MYIIFLTSQDELPAKSSKSCTRLMGRRLVYHFRRRRVRSAFIFMGVVKFHHGGGMRSAMTDRAAAGSIYHSFVSGGGAALLCDAGLCAQGNGASRTVEGTSEA
ncbi:hypothetical protein EVAR_39190_1 [Eumeta japonica]|uniref:Uncharacterized protein n=1 Tax=Eumeta variegata TaxID=151549 RepID=A0A4C1VNH4_EUMVA|nr:hypothetical protein EVAR_39190_1 [Eumeta japonica]